MSFENVVLEYSHPHIAIYLEDNTIYTETESETTVTPSFNGIQVGFFGGGRDNTVLYCATNDEFLNEFFKPNYKLYGQAGYNVTAALGTNQCGMYVMRLMPKDATYANVTIMLKYKAAAPETTTEEGEDITDTEADTRTKLYIDFVPKYIENATSLTELKTKIAALYTDEVDEDGYKSVPFMSFWQTGRGIYGNGTRLRFLDDTDYNYDNNEYHAYQLNVMEYADNGLTVRERIYGSLCEDVLDKFNSKCPSLFLEELVNDPEYGSNKIGMMVHTDTLDEIVNAYNEVAAEYVDTEGNLPTVSSKTLDVIFGLTMGGFADEILKIAETPGVNLYATDGFAMQGGSDGALDPSNPDVETTKSKLLCEAFRGEIDRALVSRFVTPANFCLDANFDVDTKREMGAFALKREYDAMTYIDTGLLETTTEIVTLLQDIKSVTAYNLVKEVGMYKWRDVDYTGKIIPMTIAHFIARRLPQHIAINQYTTPFAREDARLVAGTDYVRGTFMPKIDPDMNDVKKEIFKLGANCYESCGQGRVHRSSGITTCTINSDRRLEFNEYILQGVVDLAYSILNSKLYKIGEEEDRLRYEKHAQEEINYRFGKYLRSHEIAFVMSEKDERRNIMRLRVRLVFKTVVTRGIVEIYLDPRTYTTNVVSTS